MSENENKQPLDEKMMNAEVKRYLTKLKKAGVNPEMAGVTSDDIFVNYFSDNNPLNGRDTLVQTMNDLVKMVKERARSNLTIFICGGTSDHRKKMGQYLMSKAVLMNLSEVGDIGATLSYSDIIRRFNNYNDERSMLAENMKLIPCLFISELDPNILPKTEVDAQAYFNSVFESRRDNNRFTIVSVISGTWDIFSTTKAWGAIFSEMMDNPKIPLPEKNPNVSFLMVK